MPSPILTLTAVVAGYGPTAVVTDISLAVGAGEVVAVLGPNGAGKSTLVKVIAGLVRPRAGDVRLDDVSIAHERPDVIVKRGLSVVPERRELFSPMTVAENLEMGAYSRRGVSPRAEVEQDRERVLTLFPVLATRARQRAGTLSGGEQQMLAIGRALMARPRVLLLDEPSLGLSPRMIDAIFTALAHLADGGLTMLLVEQNVPLALEMATRAYVLRTGAVSFSGDAAVLRESADVRAAYLGEGADVPPRA